MTRAVEYYKAHEFMQRFYDVSCIYCRHKWQHDCQNPHVCPKCKSTTAWTESQWDDHVRGVPLVVGMSSWASTSSSSTSTLAGKEKHLESRRKVYEKTH